MSIKGRMAIIGGGNIGAAILRGILRAQIVDPDQVSMVEINPERAQELSEKHKIQVVASCQDLESVEVALMAIEPHATLKVVRELNGALHKDSLVMSVAAGVTLRQMQSALPENQPIIRCMPNSPVLVAKGVTALARGGTANDDHINTAMEIFGAVGSVVEIDERHINAVTALSGSGPAYVYVFVEALSDAGVRLGLDRKTAFTLAAQTVTGSAQLVIESGKHPAQLKEMVTSPGGTTIAALHSMERAGFRGIVMDGVKEAHDRARELAV
jgi:pyrroline-5-carboxylate reductase